jgi:signal peptidase I
MPESFKQNPDSQPSTERESASPPGASVGKKAQPQQEDSLVEFMKILATSLLLALGLRTFIAEARYIPSSSMEPTLLINDRLIIEKVGYHFTSPHRGDIVVFNPTPALRAANFKDAFIKRVIGVPGDKVEMRQGLVYINDQPIKESYVAYETECFPIIASGDDKAKCTLPPRTIPPQQYLVLGDNRNNSYDSRFWGLVPQDYIIGRALVRFWPPNRLGMLNTTPDYPPALK